MKIADVIKNIDKSEENREHWVDFSSLSYALGFEDGFFDSDALDARFKVYWLEKWRCTDAHVGTRVYFFDDEPVAITVQNGRKDDEKVFWTSKEAADKVHDFLLSLQKEEELDITVCDMNEDIGDSYKIEFNSQVLDWSTARYNGSPIEVIERIKKTPDYGIDKELKIRVQDTGEELIVNIKELDFLFHLESNKVKSVDKLISDAKQSCEDVNKGSVSKENVEIEKE